MTEQFSRGARGGRGETANALELRALSLSPTASETNSFRAGTRERGAGGSRSTFSASLVTTTRARENSDGTALALADARTRDEHARCERSFKAFAVSPPPRAKTVSLSRCRTLPQRAQCQRIRSSPRPPRAPRENCSDRARRTAVRTAVEGSADTAPDQPGTRG